MAVRVGVLRGAIGLKNNMKLVKSKAGRIRMGMRCVCALTVLLFILSGCSNQNNSQDDNTQRNEAAKQDAETGQETKEITGSGEQKETSSGKILIAYFTLADNY